MEKYGGLTPNGKIKCSKPPTLNIENIWQYCIILPYSVGRFSGFQSLFSGSSRCPRCAPHGPHGPHGFQQVTAPCCPWRLQHLHCSLHASAANFRTFRVHTQRVSMRAKEPWIERQRLNYQLANPMTYHSHLDRDLWQGQWRFNIDWESHPEKEDIPGRIGQLWAITKMIMSDPLQMSILKSLTSLALSKHWYVCVFENVRKAIINQICTYFYALYHPSKSIKMVRQKRYIGSYCFTNKKIIKIHEISVLDHPFYPLLAENRPKQVAMGTMVWQLTFLAANYFETCEKGVTLHWKLDRVSQLSRVLFSSVSWFCLKLDILVLQDFTSNFEIVNPPNKWFVITLRHNN